MKISGFARFVASIVLVFWGVISQAEALRIGEGRQPQVAVVGDRVYVAYAKDGEIICAASSDGGRSFGDPVAVARPKGMPVGMRRGPRIAATGDAVVITAVSGEQGGGKDGDVVAWRSTDGGKTWASLPAPLNGVNGAAREGLHAMAAGPDGQMFCAWLDLRNVIPGSSGTEIWGARSSDGGATWSHDVRVYKSADKSVCQCCHPSVAIGADGKTVAVMFRNELGGNRDMYVARSADGGKTFGEAEKLGTGSWRLAACPMDGGMLTLPGSAADAKIAPLVSVWRRESTVYLASPGERERALGKGVQPWIASGSNRTYALWVTARPGNLMLAVGDAQPIKLAENASDPSIATTVSGPGKVVAAWESGGDVLVADVIPKP